MTTSELLKEFGFEEEKWEMVHRNKILTGFPDTKIHFRLILEDAQMSVEETYFWVLTMFRRFDAVTDVIKIKDVFSASQQSSFFGNSQSRLGINQDRASSYLAQIGKLIKDMFHIVREVRVIDEKLQYYTDSKEKDKTLSEPAEIALKGVYIDQVEGGMKNPSSVYGLSQNVGFTTLPDLFFTVHPKSREDVGKLVSKLEDSINRKVREVLQRKLYQYVDWKEKTYKELDTRKNFQIKFMKQHFDVIKLYMDWVRPYLRYAHSMSMSDKAISSPDLISSIEGSFLEVELLTYHSAKTYYTPVVIASFEYRTRPEMRFTPSPDVYQHKGPTHVGQLELNIRGYVWKPDQINKYQEMRRQEDWELLKYVDENMFDVIETLKEDVEKYLGEHGESLPNDKAKKLLVQDLKKLYGDKAESVAKDLLSDVNELARTLLKLKKHNNYASAKEEAVKIVAQMKGKELENEKKYRKSQSVLAPFLGVFKGFHELVNPMVPKINLKSNSASKYAEMNKEASEKKSAGGAARAVAWNTYKFFKKSHGMLSW